MRYIYSYDDSNDKLRIGSLKNGSITWITEVSTPRTRRYLQEPPELEAARYNALAAFFSLFQDEPTKEK